MPERLTNTAHLVLYLEDWQMRMVKDVCGVDCDRWVIRIEDLKPVLRYMGPVASSADKDRDRVTLKRMYFTDWQKREISDELGEALPCDFIELSPGHPVPLYGVPTPSDAK